MVIKTRLPPDLFVRLSILRHLQRPTFYVYALLAAGITIYTLFMPVPLSVLFLGWIPFGMYILLGVIGAIRASRVKDAPYFFSTTYDITAGGIAITNPQAQTQLDWDRFEGWQQIVNTYVIVLNGGAILAIPQSDVPIHQREALEKLLGENIGQREKKKV